MLARGVERSAGDDVAMRLDVMDISVFDPRCPSRRSVIGLERQSESVKIKLRSASAALACCKTLKEQLGPKPSEPISSASPI